MTQLNAFVALGTAATLLTALLVLLRAKKYGRRQVLTLTEQWVSSGSLTSSIVLASLSAVAAYSFMQSAGFNAPKLNAPAAFSRQTSMASMSGAGDAQLVDGLRNYVNQVADEGQIPPSQPDGLPDVDTMIKTLVTRLEKDPNDVKGWKMLGWSLLNTDKYDDAMKAYETALKLDPDDAEIKKGLDAAKVALTKGSSSSETNSNAASSPQSGASADSQSGIQDNAMIRDMVERLATRLEASPIDEQGWVQLMRSRATLGEKDTAKAVLEKALAAFSSDEAAKTRLADAAKSLGVE